MLTFLFPGQNSRYPGMLTKFVDLHPDNADIVAHASEILRRDLAAHFIPSNEHQFDHNRDVQIGVFLASHLLLCSLRRAGIDARRSLGLSLGEYNHLVHIGALRFEDALPLLIARGDAYDASPRGVMASVSPISLDELLPVAERAGASVALRNTPTQHVIAGSEQAVLEALRILEEEFFLEGVFIDRRLPMHSPLFDSVAQRFRPALEATPWRVPSSPYLPNCLARPLPLPTHNDFVDRLAAHVHHPVLWRQSVECAAGDTGDPIFVEVGPKAVLTNMLSRRWLSCRRYKTDFEDHFAASFEALTEELKALGPDYTRLPDPLRQTRPAVAPGSVHPLG